MPARAPLLAMALVLALAGLLAAAPRPPPAPVRWLALPEPEPRVERDLGLEASLLLLRIEPRSIDYATLPPLQFVNINTSEQASVRLYADDGALDEPSAEQLDRLLADARRPGRPPEVTPLDRRLLRLVVRVAYRFGAEQVEVISGYRKPWRYAEGLHGKARAVDFRLVGVDAPEVAAYLRRQPRVGVGLYTHPRTRWVHLDVRDHSYHWADATPPGKRWGAARWPMDFQALEALDASWTERDDLPEPARRASFDPPGDTGARSSR